MPETVIIDLKYYKNDYNIDNYIDDEDEYNNNLTELIECIKAINKKLRKQIH